MGTELGVWQGRYQLGAILKKFRTGFWKLKGQVTYYTQAMSCRAEDCQGHLEHQASPESKESPILLRIFRENHGDSEPTSRGTPSGRK